MSVADVIERLKSLSNPERLAVIEAASQLVHEDLVSRSSEVRQGIDHRMRETALALQDIYKPGGDLTEWTSLDSEQFLDEPSPQ